MASIPPGPANITARRSTVSAGRDASEELRKTVMFADSTIAWGPNGSDDAHCNQSSGPIPRRTSVPTKRRYPLVEPGLEEVPQPGEPCHSITASVTPSERIFTRHRCRSRETPIAVSMTRCAAVADGHSDRIISWLARDRSRGRVEVGVSLVPGRGWLPRPTALSLRRDGRRQRFASGLPRRGWRDTRRPHRR